MLVNDGGVIDSMGCILCINVFLDVAAVAAVTVTIVVANVAVTVAAAAAVLATAVLLEDPDELGWNIYECVGLYRNFE